MRSHDPKSSVWDVLIDIAAVLSVLAMLLMAPGSYMVWLYIGFGPGMSGDTAQVWLILLGWLSLFLCCNVLAAWRIRTRKLTAPLGFLCSLPVLLGPFFEFTLEIALVLVFPIALAMQWALHSAVGRKCELPPNVCATCGYDREGLPRCPECGHP